MLEIHQDVSFACRIIPVEEESFVRNSPHLSQQQIAVLNGMIMNMRHNLEDLFSNNYLLLMDLLWQFRMFSISPLIGENIP